MAKGALASRGRPRGRPEGRKVRWAARAPDLLGGVPLFSGLSRRHLKQLAEHADVVGFREREEIVEAGRPAARST